MNIFAALRYQHNVTGDVSASIIYVYDEGDTQ